MSESLESENDHDTLHPGFAALGRFILANRLLTVLFVFGGIRARTVRSHSVDT